MRVFEQKEIQVNLSTLIDSRMLICANSGGGKSYAIRKLLETAGSGVMSIILDVEGEFKTLREKFDYLLIGQPGDVPVNLKSAPLLPQKLMELNVSTIIDISDLKRHDRILYVKKFLEALMELPKEFWKPCLVVIDEAHAYCGQRELQESMKAVIDLMTRGRKRGYCGILATQRISKLHKDAVAEANNYMVGRIGLDIDMKRAAEILGFASKQDMLTLRNLNAGEFYVFGTAISRYVKKVKVAKAKTTHPKVGMDLRAKLTPPTEKIKSMLSKLNDLPKEAEQKAQTIKELKRRNRELERELKKRPAPEIDPAQLELAEQRGLAKAELKLIPQIRQLNDKLSKIRQLVGTEQTEIKHAPLAVTVPLQSRKTPPVKSARRIPVSNADSDVTLGRCARSILSLLYNNPQRGFKKTLVGIFTGYSPKSSGFKNALSQLNTLGLINRGDNEVSISSLGEKQAPELLGNDVNLHETFTIDNWAQKLPKCASIIFQFLKKNPDTEFSRDEIGMATDYSTESSGFKNAVSTLNVLELIKKVGDRIKLNEEILEL